MRDTEIGSRPSARPLALAVLALVVLVLPDAVFFVVTEKPAEALILRMLALIGVSLLAVLPWVSRTGGHLRRRFRRWTFPGMAATTLYLVSTDPLYLILGFCLISGASMDMWMTRAHVASDSLRTKLESRDDDG